MRALVILGALAALVWSWRRRRGLAARQRRLMLLCQRAGLEFAPVDLFPDTRWLPFRMFGYPRSGSENVVWDRARGPEARVFDFWYQEPSDQGDAGFRRRITCAAIPLGSSCPRLRVAPREAIDDVADALLHREVGFELEAFERRFVVDTDDPRFAHAFLDQRMIEAFLGLPDGVQAELSGETLLLWAPLLPPVRVLRLFDAAAAIRRRVPRVLASLFPPRPAQGPHEERWLQGRWSSDPTGRA